jgi:RNA polymerase sigma factor (sigma-70 family)
LSPGFLRKEIMDENWPLFAARISGRSPTENEVRLLDASHRLWTSALAFTRSKLTQSPALQSDAKSFTTEIWEEALLSVLRTMEKLGDAKISDLDSYLFAIFINRFNRYLARERKRQQIIELVPSTEDLAELKGAQDSSSAKRIESEVLLREALARTDEFFRTSAWYRCQGYSWAEIGGVLGLTKEQARKRFEYGVQKLRKLLR